MTRKVILGCLGACGIGLLLICGVFVVLVVFEAPPENGVEIRIHNDMGEDISNLWLGSGPASPSIRDSFFGDDRTESFPDIERGEFTRYREIENEFRYFGQTNMTIDGKRYFHNVSPNYRGETIYENMEPIDDWAPLPEGKYTFSFFPSDKSGEADLKIIKDE